MLDIKRGVKSAVQQYIAAVQTGLEQNTDYQPAVDTQWEGLDPAELDFDPYDLFYASEKNVESDTDTAANSTADMNLTESDDFDPWALFHPDENRTEGDTDIVTDSLMPSDEIENAEEFEQSFLSGLQGDEESGIIQRGNPAETTDTAKTAQTQSVAAETSADPGVEAVVQQFVEAVELYGGKTDSGVRSSELRSAKGNPAGHREAEAMIDRTAPEVQLGEKCIAHSALESEIGFEANTNQNLPDVVIGRSVGAKAQNYDVMDLSTGEMFVFVEGSKIQNVKVFAGKGSKTIYQKAYKYAEKYGGRIEDWQHVKGVSWLSTEDGDRRAEVHWSQCEGIGKIDFFVKRWLDE